MLEIIIAKVGLAETYSATDTYLANGFMTSDMQSGQGLDAMAHLKTAPHIERLVLPQQLVIRLVVITNPALPGRP